MTTEHTKAYPYPTITIGPRVVADIRLRVEKLEKRNNLRRPEWRELQRMRQVLRLIEQSGGDNE